MNTVYRVSFQLDLTNSRDQQIYEFLVNYPPRHKAKKDFVLDALYSYITMEFYTKVNESAKEIKSQLDRIKTELIELPHKVSVQEVKEVLVERKLTIGVQIKTEDLPQIMDSLLNKAFE